VAPAGFLRAGGQPVRAVRTALRHAPGGAGRFDSSWVWRPIWLCWQATVGIGLAAGSRLPAAWKLEFAAPLAFIAMTIPFLRGRPMLAAAVSAGITAVLANALPLKLGLALAALVGIATGMLTESLQKTKAA
jgi:predicted branched-subunit amino acid permease